MIRALLLLFLALILPAAHAASDTQTGVWRGQIGRLDVIACFDNGNWGRYYYLANGHTLNLAPDDGFWREFAAKDAGLTGRWELSDPVKKRIVGEWTTKDGAHPTPIRLRSIPLQKVTKSPYPCENPAFIAPLRAMTPMTKGKYFQLGGLAWHDVSVKSVKGRKLSGVVLDETIPSPLGKALKTRLDNGVDNLLTCGGDTIWLDMLDYDSTERIAYVTPTQVVITWARYYDCGGNHPDGGTGGLVLSRSSGKEVLQKVWLKPPYDKEIVSGSTLSGKLLASYGKKLDQDCREVLSEAFSWNFWPTPEGMAASPYVARAGRACEAETVLPWRTVRPFLNVEGLRLMDEMRAAMQGGSLDPRGLNL